MACASTVAGYEHAGYDFARCLLCVRSWTAIGRSAVVIRDLYVYKVSHEVIVNAEVLLKMLLLL